MSTNSLYSSSYSSGAMNSGVPAKQKEEPLNQRVGQRGLTSQRSFVETQNTSAGCRPNLVQKTMCKNEAIR